MSAVIQFFQVLIPIVDKILRKCREGWLGLALGLI